MRIAGQAVAIDLLAEIEELLFAQATFKVGTGLDTWGDVALNIEAVAAVIFALSVPKMVKASAKHVGQ